MNKKDVLGKNFMLMAYAEGWIVVSLTGNVPDLKEINLILETLGLSCL